MNTVHLTTLTDSKFLVPTIVMMTSARENMATDSHYHFHLFHSDLEPWQIKAFQKLETPRFTVTVIKLENNRNQFTHLPDCGTRFGQAALMRLNLPNLLTDIEKVLYLDGDILVHQDLSPLYQWDIDNHLIAAVKAPLPLTDPSFLNNFPGDTYINTGVMVVNLAKMRDENTVDQFIANAPAVIQFWRCADQDIINYTCAGRMAIMPPHFNGMASLYRQHINRDLSRFNAYYNTNYTSYEELENDYVLTHWAGPIEQRPWELCNRNGSEVWTRYFLKSPIAHIGLGLKTPWEQIEALGKHTKQHSNQLQQVKEQNKQLIDRQNKLNIQQEKFQQLYPQLRKDVELQKKQLEAQQEELKVIKQELAALYHKYTTQRAQFERKLLELFPAEYEIRYGFSRYLPVVTVKHSLNKENGLLVKDIKLFGVIPIFRVKGTPQKLYWYLFYCLPVFKFHRR